MICVRPLSMLVVRMSRGSETESRGAADGPLRGNTPNEENNWGMDESIDINAVTKYDRSQEHSDNEGTANSKMLQLYHGDTSFTCITISITLGDSVRE